MKRARFITLPTHKRNEVAWLAAVVLFSGSVDFAYAGKATSLSSSGRSSQLTNDNVVDDKLREMLSTDKQDGKPATFYYQFNFAPGYDSNPKLNDPAEHSSKNDGQAILGVKGTLGNAPFKYDLFANWESLRYSRLSYWDQDNIRIKGKLSYTGLEDSYGLTPFFSLQSKNFYERWFSPWFMRRSDIEFGIQKSWAFYDGSSVSDQSRNRKKIMNVEFSLALAPRLEQKKDGEGGLIDPNNSMSYEAGLDFVYFHSSAIRFIFANELSYRVHQTQLSDDLTPYRKRALKFDSEFVFAWNFLANHSPRELTPILKFGIRYDRSVDNTNDGFYRWQVGPVFSITGRF